MKKLALSFGMVMMAAMLMIGTPATAQTRQQSRDAKKEAKKLEKEGFKTMGLPLLRQLESMYARMAEVNEDGHPKYLSTMEMAVGNSYAAAQMDAINTAKVRLAGQIQSTVMSQAKISLGNSTLSAEDAASIQKALEKSTLTVVNKLSRIIVANEYYRVLPNKNFEVHVVVLYDSKLMHDTILEETRAALQAELNDFTPTYEKVLDDIINNAVK